MSRNQDNADAEILATRWISVKELGELGEFFELSSYTHGDKFQPCGLRHIVSEGSIHKRGGRTMSGSNREIPGGARLDDC